MKSITFDTSTIVSLSMNNLLWLIKPLKKRFRGSFIIPSSVRVEVVDKPLNSKKYKLEALMIKDYIEEGFFEIFYEKKIRAESDRLLRIANKIFTINKRPLQILHLAEIESLVTASHIGSLAYVIDERTLRLLIEDSNKLREVLQIRTHRNVEINNDQLQKFLEYCKSVMMIRSSELVTISFQLGFLDKYITDKRIHKDLKKPLLEGALWGLKLRGCSITEQEINQILNMQKY